MTKRDKIMTTTHPATSLQLDARVSFDDLVNIAVSRFETQLHTARTNVQNDMKLNQANRAKFLKALCNEILNQAKKDHASITTIGQLTVTTKVSVDEDAEPKQGNIAVDVSVAFSGSNLVETQYHITKELTVLYAVPPGRIIELDTMVEEYTNLRNQFLNLNQQIQDIDRKTRQVKGLLAEQKLEAQCLTGLLEDQRIQDILQIK